MYDIDVICDGFSYMVILCSLIFRMWKMASMMRFQGKFVFPSAHTQSTCLQNQRLILHDSVCGDVVLIDLYLHFKIQSHTYTKKLEKI